MIWSSRAQEGTYNLFARLPRQTAQRLAAKEVIDTKPNTFIPLALSFEEHGEHAFVSFNGGFIEVFEHGKFLQNEVAMLNSEPMRNQLICQDN